MEDETLSIDRRTEDETGDGTKLARDILENMSSYRIDTATIRTSRTGLRKWGQRSVVFTGELAPAAESTTPESRQTVAEKMLEWGYQDVEKSNLVFKSLAYELGLITTLSHPNIVEFIGFAEDIQNCDARIILRWEGNGNAQEFLQSGEWDIPERVSLIQDTISGLEYLHTRKPPIRHGDLKSTHILVSSSYRAVITGFGEARISPNVEENNKDDHWLWSLCELEIYLGERRYSIRWAAPELLNGESASLPADIWAIGWVCWEIITGRIPFEDDEEDTVVIERVKRGDLPAIREQARLCQVLQLCSLMSDCWASNPAERINVSTFRKKVGFVPSAIPSGSTSGKPKERSADLLLELGKLYDLQNDIVVAESYYQSALNIATRNGNATAQGNALICLGRTYNIQSRYRDAEQSLMEARELHSRIGNDLGAANALIGLAELYNGRSRCLETEKALMEAQEIHSRIGNDFGVANVLTGLGEVYEAQSRYSEAEKAFWDAHKINSRIGNDLGLANVLIGLGEFYGARLRYPEAGKAFTEAREIHFRIGNDIGAVSAVVRLGEIYDAQSRSFEAEKAFKSVQDIVSRIENNLTEAEALNDRRGSYDAEPGDSEDEEFSKEAAELHFRVEPYIGASDALSDSRDIQLDVQEVGFMDEEPFEEAPEIPSYINNDSGRTSPVYNLQQVSFIQELASIGSISTPSMQYIIDLTLALAKTAPTAIRNKHQLSRILIISRDLCYHLNRVAHTGSEAGSGFDVLEHCFEIMDNLERTLLELVDIVSQETMPFGALSLTAWNNSRTGLSRIYGKLTAPPFNTYDDDDLANATWDRYFDDCSWMSLLLLEGIELPVRNMDPEAEEGLPIEAQNVIDRLNYFVNETKLNGKTNEPTREFFITILSDVARVMMDGPDNLPGDFWNGADGALQDIDPEKGLNQDLVDSLRDSWSSFADRQIQPASTSGSPTAAPTQDPISVSLPQELTRLDHEITPAAEPLVLLLHSLGRGAPTATRNKHKIYAIVSRARDICNDILAIGVRPELGGLETLDEYYNLIDALEGILLEVARLLPTEQASFGRGMCVSWSESREEFRKILNRLHEPPFRLDPSAPKQELTTKSVFDDHYWLSLLLEEGIEKELDRQYLDVEMPPAVVSVREGLRYLENEIKYSYHEETTRRLVIDIATRIYEALSAPESEKGRTAPAITLDKDTLVTTLSSAFSVLDLESSLKSRDIHRLESSWWGITHSLAGKPPRDLGETKPAETGSSGQGDQETPQDSPESNQWMRLQNVLNRDRLVYLVESSPRDKGWNENWIVTIEIFRKDRDTLRLTGTGLTRSEAKEAVGRLGLVALGDSIGKE